MVYRITVEPGYLRADLSNRDTVEETRSFLRAVVRENAKHQRRCVLIMVRSSKPIFQIVPHRLVENFEELSGESVRQIALVGDSRDLHMSHEYIQLIAKQRGLDVRSFRDEAAALRWFKERRDKQERRLPRERREQNERRQWLERREQVERRFQRRRANAVTGRVAH